ncbi:MAG: LuxR C-terminal-related transcriptional regulator [Gracilibacteraceae bacterium]|jgi:LuxR family maltose regulon positive regulatory protein|nr:LuxR C-terminal-related transcriptional regulator [Gracilibacteraceae bacterium]
MQKGFFANNKAVLPGSQLYLKRPQILQLLEKAARCPLVTVTAGAGYGKTDAVYSFLREYNGGTIWIQMTEFDNLAEIFWDNFARCFAAQNPPFAASLTEFGFPGSRRRFERYLSLSRQEPPLDIRGFLVFDDFHLIHSKAILNFMRALIDTLPQNITVILISRAEPEIDLIRLVSKGTVYRLTEDDLRFSEAELDAFFKLQGIAVSPQIRSKIYTMTEGWPFAIYLISLALKSNPSRQDHALSVMKLNIFKLMETELFSTIPAELQSFLIKLSLPSHLPLRLLEELAPDESYIAEIGKISTFIRYDAYADTYRIHPLLLEYLRQKQVALSEEERRDIFRRTAAWCAVNDCKMDAVTYYERAEDYESLAREAYDMTRMTPDGVARFLLEVLDRLPPRAFRENAKLHVVRIKMLQSLSRFTEAAAQAHAVIKQFEELPDDPFYHWILSECYFNLGYIGIFTSLYTKVCDYTDYFAKAYRHFQRSERAASDLRERTLVSSYVCRVGYPSEKGELERGIEIFSKYAHYAEKAKNGMFRGMAELASCEAAYFKADLKNAEGLAYLAAQKAREAEQFQIENRALFFLLRIALHKGEPAKITTLLRQLRAQLEYGEFLSRHTLCDIVTGWFFAQTGQIDKIAGWLKSEFEKSDLGTLSYGLESLVRAKYLFAEAKYHAVLASLESRDKQYGPEAFLIGKLEIEALRAVCLYRLHDSAAAVRVLEDAYRISENDGLDMPFIELGKDMRTLAAVAMKREDCAVPRDWLEKIRKKASTYAKMLTCAVSGSRGGRVSADLASLTKKETELLKDMCYGLSRSEIAVHHNLSMNTVKAAFQVIYTKLGAQNSADAIRIAAVKKIID